MEVVFEIVVLMVIPVLVVGCKTSDGTALLVAILVCKPLRQPVLVYQIDRDFDNPKSDLAS